MTSSALASRITIGLLTFDENEDDSEDCADSSASAPVADVCHSVRNLMASLPEC